MKHFRRPWIHMPNEILESIHNDGVEKEGKRNFIVDM